MSLLAVPILAVLAFFLVLISGFTFAVLFFRLQQKMQLLSTQIQANELLIEELQVNKSAVQNKIVDLVKESEQSNFENIQVSKQLEHRIKILQQNLNEQEKVINHWQEHQGQDKFYSRAFKLAEKGAGIDEIMSECELPRAEVEMLLSVYLQRNSR
jgi:hypothetical protein